MQTAFALLLVVHGLIHLLGFAKAFALAELPQLAQPISPMFGALWLVAAILFVSAAISVFIWSRGWWVLAACAVIVSMVAIVPSWADAKIGAFGNAIVLVGVVFGFLTQGPSGLRAEYERDVESRLRFRSSGEPITEADLTHLPATVQRYLRVAGVVGRQRIHNFRVRMHGRIRSGSEARWMPLMAEQYNFVDEPARLFYMNSSVWTIPVQGYHRYAGSAATMRVNAAG